MLFSAPQLPKKPPFGRPRLPTSRAMPAAQAQGDIGLDMLFAELTGEHPILAVAHDAFNSGETSESFINKLPPEALIAFATVCTVASSLIGKWKPAFGIFMSAACTIVNGVLSTLQKPDGTEIPKPSCGPGTKYIPSFNTCGPENALSPCGNGMGFVSPQDASICVRCPPGQRYDEASSSCVEGCPQGWSFFSPKPEIGCVVPTFGQRCTLPDGSKGIVGPDGGCTPDGCEAGMIFDYATNSCVPDGTQTKTPPPEDKPQPGDNPPHGGEESGSKGMSGTTKTVLAIGALGVAVTVAIALSGKPSTPPARSEPSYD